MNSSEKDRVAKLSKLEEELACKYCGRFVLAGPPCCYKKVYDMWVLAQKEVEWLRKIQSRQAKRINKLVRELNHGK